MAKKMRTIQEVKNWIYDEFTEKNTLFGQHLVFLDRPDEDRKLFRTDVHYIELAMQIFAQLENNGYDLDNDSISLGSFSKAYYQVKLSEYDEYQ